MANLGRYIVAYYLALYFVCIRTKARKMLMARFPAAAALFFAVCSLARAQTVPPVHSVGKAATISHNYAEQHLSDIGFPFSIFCFAEDVEGSADAEIHG